MAEFDYITIGTGIDGLVRASRLSEDANYSVLLKARPDRAGDPRINIPGLVATLYGDPISTGTT